MKRTLPPELLEVRAKAMRAIGPLKPLSSQTNYDAKQLFLARRTDAGRSLPPYYLVYFLLIELLEFPHGGPFDKTAWSVAVDWNGQGFLVDHRKMGVGIFAQDVARDEASAKQIAIRINKAVKAAEPFFDWLAADTVARSAVNVVNNSSDLYGRYEFLRNSYRAKREEHDQKMLEYKTARSARTGEIAPAPLAYPPYSLISESNWLALSAVEAFFAWSEHVLIHLSVLLGRITSAQEVTEVAEADWGNKFRAALDVCDCASKMHYDRLLTLRKELRNYVAHGAFGKQGEAFRFHSGAGAVPVLLPHRSGSRKFKLASGLSFDAVAAIRAMDEFCAFLWSDAREPAKICIQDAGLPTILTYATDGTYLRAMQSISEMQEFVDYLTAQMDRAANMDW